MKQQEYDLLGVPAGIATNHEVNLKEMRMKENEDSAQWDLSVRLDQMHESLVLSLFFLHI